MAALVRPFTSGLQGRQKTWMPRHKAGMTTNVAARGVLKRHCADGKTPLPREYLCNRRFACQSGGPAGEFRESHRSRRLICACRAADPDLVAGTNDWAWHRRLRLFAGATRHARFARLVLFGRG